jgi:DNA-binding CsgD family transcriptional regulator
MNKLSPSDRINRCNSSEIKPNEVYDALSPFLEVYRPVIELFAINEPCELALLDLLNDRFLYYLRKADSVLNYFLQPGCNENFGVGFFLDQLDTNDVRFINETKTLTFEYLKTLPNNQRHQYRLTIDFCYKIADHHYCRMMHHSIPFSTADDGSVWIVVTQLYLISENNHYTPPMRLLRKMREREDVLFPKSDEHTIYLTKRQRETIQLWSGGLVVKEIANQLSIDKSTTNHHLSNGRKRMNIITLGQMVHYCGCLGLI